MPQQSSLPILEDQIIQALSKTTTHPVPRKKLSTQVSQYAEGRRMGRVDDALDSLISQGRVVELENGVFLLSHLPLLAERIIEVLDRLHRTYPYRNAFTTGEVKKKRMSKGQVQNSRRNVDPELFMRALTMNIGARRILQNDDGLELIDFQPDEAGKEWVQSLERSVMQTVREYHWHKLEIGDLADAIGQDPVRTRILLRRLVTSGQVVNYGDARYVAQQEHEQCISQLRLALEREGTLETPAIKKLLGIPRNALIDYLEYLDELGFTRREGGSRRLVS